MALPTDSTAPAGPELTPTGAPRSRTPLRLTARALVGLVVVASFGVWVYAFSGLARRDPPDLLDDPSFAAAAEEHCAAALTDLAGLPGALDARSEEERASQIEQSTARLETMLAQLEALPTGSAQDSQTISGWLADWRILISDRYDYAVRIARDPNAEFLITDTGVAERLDRRITRVADANEMSSCGTPGDVG